MTVWVNAAIELVLNKAEEAESEKIKKEKKHEQTRVEKGGDQK